MITIQHANQLRGEISVPGDKSISHRAVMLGSLAKGTTRIRHFLEGADCLSTIACFRKMGVEIEKSGEDFLVHGRGLHGLKAPSEILDCGNSGTTMRLLSGILAGQNFNSELTGDSSLQKRPMKRVMEPLSCMGADIRSRDDSDCAPLLIAGRSLHGADITTRVASAQVKSAILLAGLYAEGTTSVTEPVLSRNHTEIMLNAFGGKVESSGTTACLTPVQELFARDISVPGDISSAAYFASAACLVPGSEILIRNVGINPTRDGFLRALYAMGAHCELLNRKEEDEPCADLLVRFSQLKGTLIEGDWIPSLIDEIPVLAVLAAFAEGTTVIRDAAELKVKESNRIRTVTEGLLAMGADVTETEDGMVIRGGRPLHGADIFCHEDHRIAMSFAVAALAADGETRLHGAKCVNISYPDFFADLKTIRCE